VRHPDAKARAQLTYLGKRVGRRLRWAPRDLADGLGRRHRLVPPRGLVAVGGGDFRADGAAFAELFVRLGGLEPDDRVLDVGCGIGRMAIPLLDVIDRDGSYEGFDTSRPMIRWCRRTISRRDSRFRFWYAPIFNRKYNPFGTVRADAFVFPYRTDEFDFAFATSVFTHLPLADGRNYLAELSRVLRPGGRALLTFFLLDHLVAPAGTTRPPMFDFRFAAGRLRTIDPARPEEAIAYPEQLLRDELARAGLLVAEPVRYGSWSGRESDARTQDIVVVVGGEITTPRRPSPAG
jgi:SAM-dependent methyltransferase